jgi:hypothetical protein
VALRDRRLPALALCLGLALLHTWPLVSAPGTLSRTDNADTMLNQWILAWVAHALVTNPLDLFNANIFYPEPRTLAFSEHLFVPALFGAPAFWLGGSPVLVYNIVLWCGLALTAWTTSLVIHRWTGDWWAALTAGSLAAFNTETLTRFGHIQAMHVEFLPLALLALDDVLRDGRRRDGVRLGVFAAAQMLCSGYLLVMTAVSLVVGTLAQPARWLGTRARVVLPALLLGIVVMGALTAPFLYQYYRVQHDQGLTRDFHEIAMYAAAWNNYVATGGRFHFEWWSRAQYLQANSTAFPGVLPLLLALVAVLSGVALRDGRARMWLCIGLAGMALSFGPRLPGYELLYYGFPLLQGIRAVSRFGFLWLFAVAVLSGFGLAWLRARLSHRMPNRAWAATAVGALCFVVVNLENTRVPMAYVEAEEIPAIYRTLADQDDAIVAEFPFPESRRVANNGAYVWASTQHWKPLLNGYSGFLPMSYGRHWEAFHGFPDPSVIDALRTAGVTHIVVHMAHYPDAVAALRAVPGVTLFAQSERIRIYRIR